MNKHIEKIEALIGNMQLEEALDYIEGLSSEVANSWQIQNLTGIICSYCGQFSEAIPFFRRALLKETDNPEIYFNLADAYCNLKEYQRAELMLQSCEAITLDENLLEAVRQLREQIKAYKEKEDEENNVLMIAYYFPPLSGSGVFRSIKYAKYLPELGWNTTVISADKPPRGWDYRDDSMVDEIPDCVDVTRIEDEINTAETLSISAEQLSEVFNFLGGVLVEKKEAIDILNEKLKTKEGAHAMIQFPCSCLCWAWKVVKHIEANMDINKFSVIYTTTGPLSSHLVGYYLKKKYGIPWVADYRDLWTDNPYGQFSLADTTHRLLYYLEEILMKYADSNIFVEESVIDKYTTRLGMPKDRFKGITNGYDESDFSALNYNIKPTNKFTINYSGLLYTKQHDISPILFALKELIKEGKIDLDNIRFRVVGQGSEKFNEEVADCFGVSSILEQTGYVSHKEALQANVDANMLLHLVGSDEKFKLVHTGKFFEYLRSGKPVLAIAPPGGVVDNILTSTGHGKAFLSTQIQAIKDMILQEYVSWLSSEENTFLHSPLIKVFERKYLTTKLADVLYQVRDGSKNETENDVYNASYLSGGPAKSYHKRYAQSFYYPAWRHAMRYLYLLDRNIQIFEIACGVGQFANFLFDVGFTNYRGFDFAAEGVKIAKESNKNHADKFFVADAFETPEVAEKHDLVICFEMLEHIHKDLELLKRIQPGTKLLLSVPNFADTYHVRHFSSEQEVYNRYSKVMRIDDISRFALNSTNCLYYIVGEKL